MSAALDLHPQKLYHVGVVVADMAEGMREWSSLVGVQWREPMSGRAEVFVDGISSEQPVPAVYSVDGPVYLELLPLREGTVWGQVGLHHLGYWSDDVAGDTAVLVDSGATLEATIVREGTVLATYLLLGAARTELTASSSRRRLIG